MNNDYERHRSHLDKITRKERTTNDISPSVMNKYDYFFI